MPPPPATSLPGSDLAPGEQLLAGAAALVLLLLEATPGEPGCGGKWCACAYRPE